MHQIIYKAEPSYIYFASFELIIFLFPETAAEHFDETETNLVATLEENQETYFCSAPGMISSFFLIDLIII